MLTSFGIPARVAARRTASPARGARLAGAIVVSASLLSGCFPAVAPSSRPSASSLAARSVVRLERLPDLAHAWSVDPPRPGDPLRRPVELRGLRLLADARPPMPAGVALVRSIIRANHRVGSVEALVLATVALRVARRHHLDPEFFAATVLQESGFGADALSPAGAVGIGQFTLDTAATEGVDPFDWRDSLRGSAELLGRYVNFYATREPDPYAAALAAYNAGPGSVASYHGIPPYPETRAYIADIYDRWGRLVGDERGSARRSGTRGA